MAQCPHDFPLLLNSNPKNHVNDSFHPELSDCIIQTIFNLEYEAHAHKLNAAHKQSIVHSRRWEQKTIGETDHADAVMNVSSRDEDGVSPEQMQLHGAEGQRQNPRHNGCQRKQHPVEDVAVRAAHAADDQPTRDMGEDCAARSCEQSWLATHHVVG